MEPERRVELAYLAGLAHGATEDTAQSKSTYFQKLNSSPIPHRTYNAVIKRVAALHLRRLEGHQGGGMLVTGQSGSGKSFLAETYAATFTPEAGLTRQCVPVLVAEVPSRPTVATVVAELLRAIGAPNARGGATEWRETDRLLHFIRELGTEIILLDEVNNFHDHAGQKVLTEFTDWVKYLQKKCHLPIVMFGLPRSTSVILRNMQLRRRFFGRMSLAAFSTKPAASWREFRSVLTTLCDRTPVAAVEYSDQLLARRFYYASSGLMDYLYKIINKALEIALRDGQGISQATLAEAFATDVWDNCPADRNPFLIPVVKLRLLTQPGEPFDDWDYS